MLIKFFYYFLIGHVSISLPPKQFLLVGYRKRPKWNALIDLGTKSDKIKIYGLK